MVKIEYLLKLLKYFIITEIVSGVELIILIFCRDFFLSLMKIENDVLGLRHAIVFLTIIVIPLVFFCIEYNKKEEKILEALSNIF